jgi:hypothetical protein
MRYTFVVLALVILGCSPDWRTHEPRLGEQPKDHARYQSDLDGCRQTVMYGKPNYGENAAIGAFGVVGAGLVGVSDPDAFTAPNTNIDQCMAQKGYKLADEPR